MLKCLRTAAERLAVYLSLACGVALLASCGGGGGGGVGDSGPFSVTYDRTSIDLAWDVGSEVPQGVVQARSFGTPGGKIYVGVDTPNHLPDPAIDRSEIRVTSNQDATVRIFPNPALTPGTYTGTLLLLVCSDPTCSRHFTGSPATLAYQIVVRPGIRLTPSALAVANSAGLPRSSQVAVALPPDVSEYAVSTDDAAVTVDQRSATGLRVNTPAREPGTYTTHLTLTAGSYQRVLTVTETVGVRTLQLDTTELTLQAVSGQPAVAHVGILTLPPGASTVFLNLHFNAEAQSWLHLSNITPTGFDVVADSLPSGTYDDMFSVRDDQLKSGSATIRLSYVVRPPAGGDQPFSTTVKSLNLSAAEGASTTQTLPMTPPSWNPDVAVAIEYSGSAKGWLSTSVLPGTGLQVTAQALGLAKGSYYATLTLKPAYPSRPVVVPVALTVGSGLATPVPQTLVIGAESTPAALAGSVPVVGNGVAAASWTAVSSVPWLRLTRSSGDLTTPLTYEADLAQVLALPAFTDLKAGITIQANAVGAAAGSALTPVTAQVVLRNELPEVLGVGPAAWRTGRAGTLIVRGRGFDHLGDPVARLSITGITPQSVAVVSPTAINVTLPMMSAGDRAIALSNALGAATASGVLRVVDAPVHAAGKVATGGQPTSLVYDPIHGLVFLANPTLGVVQRARETSSGWVSDRLAFTAPFDIGMSPDGSWLVVVESKGTLHLVDPVAFTVTSSHPVGTAIINSPGSSTGHGLPFTDDGRVWIGSVSQKGPTRFHLASRAFDVPGLHGGPMEVSRNGERLLIGQVDLGNTISYGDQSSGTWRLAPAAVGSLGGADNGVDETGSRMMVNAVVYDADFAAVGRASDPLPKWVEQSTVLSPDGGRVYRYVFPINGTGDTRTPYLTVFDAGGAPSTQTSLPALPVLGSVPLSDFACLVVLNCLSEPRMNISPDGRTVFVAGENALLVIPVPQALAPRVKATSAGRTGASAAVERLR